MAQEALRNTLRQVAGLPGARLKVNDARAAIKQCAVIARELGYELTFITCPSPREFYIINRAHPAIASLYSGNGLLGLAEPVAGQRGNEQNRAGSDQSVSDKGPSADQS